MWSKMVYLIGHESSDQWTNSGEWYISYVMDRPKEQTEFAYWSTRDINDAKRFNSKEEVFEYLLNNPQQYGGAILLEYTEEYLEQIKDNEVAKHSISYLGRR